MRELSRSEQIAWAGGFLGEFTPGPDPEPNSNWDPSPARCHCGEIIDASPNGKGWCQFHGVVDAVYSTSFQETEMADEGEEA